VDPCLVYGRGRFENIAAQDGPHLQEDHNGRSVSFGDLDNRGRTDVIVSPVYAPIVLLHNKAPKTNHSPTIAAVAGENRDTVGAKLALETNGR
jgi:hypothetical protein